jgi:GTP-binding protein
MLDVTAVNYQLVLTKSDKIKPTALTLLLEKTGEDIKRRPASHPVIHATSSEKGDGIEPLRAEIAALIAQ